MTPAVLLLKHREINHRIHTYPHDPKTRTYGLEAAEKLDLPPHRVFKTLLVSDGQRLLAVAVIPVATTLDLKKLAQVLDVKKLAMADPALAERQTGYQVGGISPLGQKRILPTVIDDSGGLHETVFVSGGRRGLELELAASDLCELIGGRFADIGRPSR